MADHPRWVVNLVNRIDPDGTLRDTIDRQIERAFGYSDDRPDADAEPRSIHERQPDD